MPNLAVQPEVFISYAWGGASEDIALRIEQTFQAEGIGIIRDKNNSGYGDSIREFMQRLGLGKFIVLVISDAYLKKENCMYELLQIYKNGSFKERILPVVLDDARIYSDSDALDYVLYWQEEIKDLDNRLRLLDTLAYTQGIINTINLYSEIRQHVNALSEILRDINTLSVSLLGQSDFSPLIHEMNRRLSADHDRLKTEAENQKSSLIYEVLKKLNFLDQKSLLHHHLLDNNASHKGGAFIIHGKEGYGQFWLYNVLLTSLFAQVPEPIRIDFQSVPMDLKNILKNIKQKLGLGSNFNQLDIVSETKKIISKIIDRLVNEPVIITIVSPFLFLKLNLKEFSNQFWIPLMNEINARNSPNKIILFFIEEKEIDFENDCILTDESYFETSDHSERSQKVLKSSAISVVTDDIFKIWVIENTGGNDCPHDIKEAFSVYGIRKDKRRVILEECGGGIPMRLILKVCEQIHLDFQQYESIWMRY